MEQGTNTSVIKHDNIFAAIYANDIEAVKTFLPTQFNARDIECKTLLHCACMRGRTEIVRLLLDSGADIEARDNDGRTPLHITCWYGKTEIVCLLLDSGADIEVRDDSNCIPLHYACQNSHIEIISLLLDRNTNIEACDNDGWTALHISCAYGNHSVSEYLVSRGADPFINTNEGYNAIVYDDETVIDKEGNEIPHRQILIQLRDEYLNRQVLDKSKCTAALSSGWEMEM